MLPYSKILKKKENESTYLILQSLMSKVEIRTKFLVLIKCLGKKSKLVNLRS